MPTVFRLGNVRFFFYSNEGDPREPVHIHAESPEGRAKFWLWPDVTLASSSGYDRRQLAQFAHAIMSRRALIESAWNDHFS